ncbi:hypothetical protein [Azospirillum canadense]|uniref:hypothetical protein n=1 Tax=Azospirillum canadense TaxID=403962 RepID=UPI0022267937|nr:hypothetical protein [Azospirillum canadense]MCW2240367.1 prepilin signal peptidase PulO-like enzyme (type II secretory pathway) [Azospirillum canadense]
MTAGAVVCAVAAVGGGAPSGVAVLVQAVAALALAAGAGWVNRRGLLAMAVLEAEMAATDGGGWSGRPVARWEAWAVVAASGAAVLAAWVAAVSVAAGWTPDVGCVGGWRGLLAPVVAGVAAAGAVFVLVDDLRHHGVEAEPVAVCFATAILWHWLSGGGSGAAGDAAVAGVLAGGGFWVVNAGLRVTGSAFGNGDAWLVAAAGAWIGGNVWAWATFAGVSLVCGTLLYGLRRGKPPPAAPYVAAGTLAALATPMPWW